VGAPDEERSANGEASMLERVRSSPRILIAITAIALLVCAWIGWAIYVTSSRGATAGLGVVIAWPAILTALAVASLPFIGLYLLIRRLSGGEASTSDIEADVSEGEDADGEEPREPAEEEAVKS
jgi:hypothetical protein